MAGNDVFLRAVPSDANPNDVRLSDPNVSGDGSVTGSIATSQAQTIAGAGAAQPASVSGDATTSQAQTIAASGAFGAIGVSGTVATSQAQTVAASGTASPASVSGVLAASQAQTITGTGTATVQPVTGVLSSSQVQTALLAGNASPAEVSGTAAASQAQTIAASGSFAAAGGVSGVGSTSQVQSNSGVGEVSGGEVVPSFNGGFVMRPSRKVYVKRGKQYLIFNNNDEADAYLSAEDAIEAAKKSSRGAARRVVKALKVAKPEIAPEPKLQELSDLIAKFNIDYDLIQLQKNNDIEALYQIQSMLYALQQDEEDIELLLLAI